MNPTEKEILKQVLEPLLQDFEYWFSQSHSLLESENIPFLSQEEQTKLLERIEQAQGEVKTTMMLFKVTDGQAGVDTKVLIPWHQLVSECWTVSRRFRSEKEQLQ
jgi:predicted flavoprotein YhiN